MGILRKAAPVALVLVLIVLTAGVAVAGPARTGAVTAASTFIYADDPGWVKSGSWVVEDYTRLPPPDSGPKLLVANDAGASVSFTVTGGKHFEVYASRYWTCGNMEIWTDGKYRATVDLNLDSDYPTYDNLVFSGAFPGKPDDAKVHTLTIRCAGTGGPGGGLSSLHFSNIQYVEVY